MHVEIDMHFSFCYDTYKRNDKTYFGKEVFMGIFIDVSIAKSVTREEWSRVYEETLQFP